MTELPRGFDLFNGKEYFGEGIKIENEGVYRGESYEKELVKNDGNPRELT